MSYPTYHIQLAEEYQEALSALLMEEDADRDANAASSEGIFVFDTTNNPSVGDQVAIT